MTGDPFRICVLALATIIILVGVAYHNAYSVGAFILAGVMIGWTLSNKTVETLRDTHVHNTFNRP